MRGQLTDEMLIQASKQVAASIKASLPVPEECRHEFPPKFESDMKRLIAQTERRYHIRKYLRGAVAACLAAAISLSTWLAVDAEARAAFVQWVKTVYEQSVVYEFFHSGDERDEVRYRLSWVPEGYTMENEVGGDEITTLVYLKGESAIYFTYEYSEDGAKAELFPGVSNVEPVQVNGMPGEFYLPQDPAESNSLVWFDEENCILCSISGFIDKESMVRMANSVEAITSTD